MKHQIPIKLLVISNFSDIYPNKIRVSAHSADDSDEKIVLDTLRDLNYCRGADNNGPLFTEADIAEAKLSPEGFLKLCITVDGFDDAETSIERSTVETLLPNRPKMVIDSAEDEDLNQCLVAWIALPWKVRHSDEWLCGNLAVVGVDTFDEAVEEFSALAKALAVEVELTDGAKELRAALDGDED